MIDPKEVSSEFVTVQIHPLAHVENATLGARTKVWQFASVVRGAVLGEDCNVAHGAMIDGSKLGDRCVVGPNAAMGPGFLIGDDVFIGPGVVICNDRWPRTHKVGFDITPFLDGHYTVVIGNGASIGANAVILGGVVIGAGAMIAAGTVVRQDVPANMLLLPGRCARPVDIIEEQARRIVIRASVPN